MVFLARRFENTGVNLEDLISIGTIGLIKAISTYRLDRNIKLATYASRCIENEILMHIRKIAPLKAEVSLDEPINMDGDGNELLLSDVLGTDEDSERSGPENGHFPILYFPAGKAHHAAAEKRTGPADRLCISEACKSAFGMV